MDVQEEKRAAEARAGFPWAPAYRAGQSQRNDGWKCAVQPRRQAGSGCEAQTVVTAKEGYDSMRLSSEDYHHRLAAAMRTNSSAHVPTDRIIR